MKKQKLEHINLIRKIAWSFHKSTGIEWNELFLQASYIYCKGLQSYEPSRGKITTYLWLLITSELTTFVTKEQQIQEPLDSLDVVFLKPDSHESNFMEKLSKEAMKVAEFILANAEEYDCLSPQEAKERVTNKLQEEGKSMKEIWIGIRDLKLACSN